MLIFVFNVVRHMLGLLKRNLYMKFEVGSRNK